MLSRKDFKKEATAIINWIDEYYQQLPSLPVKSQVLPKQIYEQIPEKAPQEGEAMATIVNDLNAIIYLDYALAASQFSCLLPRK